MVSTPGQYPKQYQATADFNPGLKKINRGINEWVRVVTGRVTGIKRYLASYVSDSQWQLETIQKSQHIFVVPLHVLGT